MKSVLNIAVLTSSRADYGIYQPLLEVLKDEELVHVELIAFGMHLLKNQGETIKMVEENAFFPVHRIDGVEEDDSTAGIVRSYGRLIENFSSFWKDKTYDAVICLGDRFEMNAAVQSLIPFGYPIVHLHGGETTLGALDNIYRHQITLASRIHLTATEAFSAKVKELISSAEGVFTVGSISLSTLKEMRLPDWNQVRKQFHLPNKPFVLTTFHPETTAGEKNKKYLDEVVRSIEGWRDNYHFVITLPNNDSYGSQYRDAFRQLSMDYPESISLVETFGRDNYFAAMNACAFLLGNTSSGIIEAASFNKWVVNVGDRQKGRLRSKNVLDVPFDQKAIDQVIKTIEQRNAAFKGENIYYRENTRERIVEILKNEFL